jgi:hypothetical protein
MKFTLTLRSVYPEQNIMKLCGTDVDNEKYVLIPQFHVWCCFVVGAAPFGLSNIISLFGHFGRGDDTTQKAENLQSNTSTATSVAEMCAMLNTDNSSLIT